MTLTRTLLISAFALFAFLVGPARADDADLVNGKVRLADVKGDGGYRLTENKDYATIRTRMMKRRALEEFAKFLSPVRMPKTLWIYADECKGGAWASPYYSPDNRALVICYQFMKVVEAQADRVIAQEKEHPNRFPMRVTREGFIAGVYAGVMLHEAGHAMFDILGVPVFGREEDAADEISTFVSLQFKKELADIVVASYADLWEAFGDYDIVGQPAPKSTAKPDKEEECARDAFCAFSDVHGSWQQRFYNTLCLTYGSDPLHYDNLLKAGWLPRNRDCVAEYKQVYRAFATTIYPFIDTKLVAQVTSRQWFLLSEMK